MSAQRLKQKLNTIYEAKGPEGRRARWLLVLFGPAVLLFFVVTTFTTTGFGDITLAGSAGRMLSVVIMIVGVSLFLNLVRAIFRPAKVRYECPDCGLDRHDPDSVHCKHCGRLLHITTHGR
jgi:hypothetical protein